MYIAKHIWTSLAVAFSVTTAAADLHQPQLLESEFLQVQGSGCPSAYVEFPNAPLVQYQDTSVLVASRLIASVSAETIGSEQITKAQPYLEVPAGNSTLGGFTPAAQGADLYQVHYRSTNVSDGPALVSGLVALPTESMAGGLVVYMHATAISHTAGAPSTPSEEGCAMITALAGQDRLVAMPDYLGYGINSDIHPYATGIYNAPSGVDIIHAARELAAKTHPDQIVGPGLYITGYSEGGGNALWLGRLLQESEDSSLLPTLIAPMSGNYDMTGAQAHSMIVNQPADLLTLASKPLLVAFSAQAAWQIENLKPRSLLRDALLVWDAIYPLPITASSPFEIRVALAALSASAFLGGYVNPLPNPGVLMNKHLRNAIATTDLSNPAVRLWAENDNLEWIPKVSVYATGILQDQVVPFAAKSYPVPPNYDGGAPFFAQGNSENLIRSMRLLGVAADRVAWCGIDGTRVATNTSVTASQKISHITGLVPVSILAARFIEQGSLNGLPQIPDPQ